MVLASSFKMRKHTRWAGWIQLNYLQPRGSLISLGTKRLQRLQANIINSSEMNSSEMVSLLMKDDKVDTSNLRTAQDVDWIDLLRSSRVLPAGSPPGNLLVSSKALVCRQFLGALVDVLSSLLLLSRYAPAEPIFELTPQAALDCNLALSSLENC